MLYSLGKEYLQEFRVSKSHDLLKTLKHQYMLDMQFIDALWVVSPSKFSFDREVFHGGLQKCENSCAKSIGLFGGSTTWGWGIDKEDGTLHHILSKKLQVDVYNYSQPAWTIYDHISNFNRNPNLLKIHDYYIFNLGINEFHHYFVNNSNYYNCRIHKTFHQLEPIIKYYYYNSEPSYNKIFKMLLKRCIHDIKFCKRLILKKTYALSKGSSLPSLPESNPLLEINERLSLLLPDSNFSIMWEPSIFTKSNLTDMDQNIISLNKSRRDYWSKFSIYFQDCTNKYKNNYYLGNSVFLGNFFDYCHYDSFTNNIISQHIKQNCPFFNNE